MTENIENEEWLTAAEYAKRAGVSVVTAYNRFKEDGVNFKTENGIKKFSSRALDLHPKIIKQTEESEDLSELINLYKNLINDYKVEIESLKAQIESKDTQILELTKRFAALAEREQDLTDKALMAAGQAQTLHAISETKQSIPELESDLDNKTAEKRSILSRLFGKKTEY